ncbi:MAG: ABC transporter permease, partial [Vallitaleaceae bacterium]|jgi:rhamnose transport system permease protein|nr:ABC transporter permease [Vallitaleaceae bacterium]
MDRENKATSILKRIMKDRSVGLVMACLVILIMAWRLTPQLLTGNALNDMLKNNSIAGIMAIGMLMVLVTKGIDLSVAATMVFSGLVVSMINADHPGVPVWLLVLLAIGIGLVIGLYNGILISKLKLLPIIATLSTLYVVRGLSYIVSDSRWIVPANYTDSYKAFATGRIFGVSNLIITALILFALATLVMGYTLFGRRIYAIGSSSKSAAVTGIKSDLVILAVYMIMGGIAGLCGFLYTSNYAIAQSTMAMGMELDVIAICILGGVNITGGTGRVSGVIVATILFALIGSFLSMLSGLSIWTDAIKGVIIIGAVLLNIYTTRASTKRALRERNI